MSLSRKPCCRVPPHYQVQIPARCTPRSGSDTKKWSLGQIDYAKIKRAKNFFRRQYLTAQCLRDHTNIYSEFMNRLLIVGILVISTVPLFAQAQQPDAAKLKADAQKVVSIISGDKVKTQTYCQIANVGEQMNQAVQAKDKKKFDELAQKLPELEKNLGPEYLGLVESLGKVSLTPKDGQEIVSMFDTLDESCPH
jgi:hypothetical protein